VNESDSSMQVDAGMIRDAPAHNAPHDQPHGAPTAPASSAPFVASAHGAPPGQPHGAPDCASGSGSDVPVHPALDGSDLSDAAADDKKRNAARALAQKKRSSKASLGAKQAAEKDKEDIEKQCVVRCHGKWRHRREHRFLLDSTLGHWPCLCQGRNDRRLHLRIRRRGRRGRRR